MLKRSFGKTKYIPVPQDALPYRPAKPGQAVCPQCTSGISEEEMQENFKVCPFCRHHFPMNAHERLSWIAEAGSFEEWDTGLSSYNPLEFPGYDEKLADAREKTGLQEAIITGVARVQGYQVVLGIMDSRFLMGSMGSVVGEKISRAIEKAMELGCPFITFAVAGGARMQEGMLSLMQMAKTSAALERFHKRGLLYISVMTHPTVGGVPASFAGLGDIIIGEPGALIGFTGPRVIEQTLGQRLPERFQRAEFQLEHGMLDLVVDRAELPAVIGQILRLHLGGNHG
ncbi:MAG TPA: acetyl-CoA carboxylase carboxyl transferase subunit beta [Syntrophomonas sp.]|jgi:acetyl-CoA carboxylase carboxyl transferase subunit beta|nr:acetyl-CoA carboxylase carboxyl transferase subunit beta [Syntrophomonas sp.]